LFPRNQHTSFCFIATNFLHEAFANCACLSGNGAMSVNGSVLSECTAWNSLCISNFACTLQVPQPMQETVNI